MKESGEVLVVLTRWGISKPTHNGKPSVSAAYVYNLLRLPWLAPDITAAIVNDRQPPQPNAMKLMRQASRLPADWSEQRTLLGFR